MIANFALWRPFALGAPELLVILIVLLVFSSAPMLPMERWRRDGAARLTPGEIRFLVGLGVVLAVLVGVLLTRGSPH